MLIHTLQLEQASIIAAVVAPETFKRLVLIAVIAAGAELLRHGFFS